MTSSEKISLIVAVLAIIGGTVSTILSGKYQMETAQAQIQKDVRLAQVQALDKKEQLIREKFEALMVEASDLVSYLDAHNSFPVADAKERVAKWRRAAFALSAHAGPDLSAAALKSVEVMNFALSPTRSQDISALVATSKDILTAAANLRQEFDKELSMLAAQRTDLVVIH